MTDLEKIYQEKVNRFELTQRGKMPDRVPVYSLIDNWAFSYSGYSLNEIFNDDDKHIAAYEKVAKDFYWDSVFTGFTSKAMNYVSALGGGSYTIENGTMQREAGSISSMQADEYDQLIADPYSFIRDVISPRKYSLMQMEYSEEKQKKYNDSINYFLRFRKLGSIAAERFAAIGVPIAKSIAFLSPVDIILDFFRDFQGTMMDIKRNPKKVAEAADAMVPMTIDIIETLYPVSQEGKSIYNPLNLPPFLRPKDFEKVYWPSYKKIVDYLAEKNYVVQSYYERNYSHLYDFLQELPKNSVFGLFEDDDLKVVKEKLGKTMCIGGGMELYSLYNGTKQDCIDMAKKLIDDLAPGGNYIFTTNRLAHSANDINPKNLKAVNEFVHEYGIYK